MQQRTPKPSSWRATGAVGVLSGLSGEAGSVPLAERFDALRLTWAALFEAELAARRPFLWLAPLSMVGVLAYFVADEEPALWAPLGLSCGLLATLVWLRNARSEIRFVLFCLFAIVLGFTSATLRTVRSDAPVLQEGSIGRVDAVIETIDWNTKGARLLVRPLVFRHDATDLPYRFRLTLKGRPALAAGDHIATTIRVMPPPVPARPGGYDFARDAYFARIGAVGSILGAVKVLSPIEQKDWRLTVNVTVDRMRNALTDRIVHAIGGQSGAVAAALITGKRGYISDETNEMLRAAGIYHVVSISGLHMVLAAGMVFFFVRGICVLVPSMALRYPIKQWAAFAAMLGATTYDIFAGSEVATERSLVMTLILFGAVLAGRRALSMRNLAFAAFVIVAIEPETVMGPSFQMSFAAVAALIAAFERLPPASDRLPAFLSTASKGIADGPPPGVMQRAGRWLVRHGKVVILTTLLAELATGPFAAFHFQRFQPLGLIGNALAIPLIELAAMPAGFIGVLAIPFGLDGPLWRFMGLSADLMLYVSRWVASTPYATRAVPAISLAAVLTLAFGLLWLTLWSTRLRWIGLLPIAAGFVIASTGIRPDIVVARDGLSLAARGPDGKLAVMGKGTSEFVVAQWLQADGDLRQPGDPSVKSGPLCNATGCIAKLGDGRILTLTLQMRDLVDDCKAATVLVTPFDAPDECMALTIDKSLSAERGSIELLPNGKGGFDLRGARQANYNRPWSPKPKARMSDQTSPEGEPDDPTREPITPR